jgi:hypothetical protein
LNSDSEEAIVFLPDDPSRQASLDDNKSRYRWGKEANTKTLIAVQESSEFGIQRVTKELSWKTMLTFEQWQSGRRMPNVVSKLRF